MVYKKKILLENKKRAKCIKCGYSWMTRSKMNKVCCPNCMYKVKLKENKRKI